MLNYWQTQYKEEAFIHASKPFTDLEFNKSSAFKTEHFLNKTLSSEHRTGRKCLSSSWLSENKTKQIE